MEKSERDSACACEGESLIGRFWSRYRAPFHSRIAGGPKKEWLPLGLQGSSAGRTGAQK